MAAVRDRFHKQAASYYWKLSRKKTQLVTSEYALVETYTRIRYDDGHNKVLQFHSVIQEAIQGGRLHLEWVTPPIHQEAWDIFGPYSKILQAWRDSKIQPNFQTQIAPGK